jgi:hypothetical protein
MGTAWEAVMTQTELLNPDSRLWVKVITCHAHGFPRQSTGYNTKQPHLRSPDAQKVLIGGAHGSKLNLKS